jgi:phosphoserine aminotransferase
MLEKNSMFNTPPCFAIYTVQLVLKWLEDTIGGLDNMAALNRKKAGLLYDYMDQSGFYRATAKRQSRSLMNVTFRLPSEDLEKRFVAEALENGLGGSKATAAWADAGPPFTTRHRCQPSRPWPIS